MNEPFETYAQVEARLHQLWLECMLVAGKPETLTDVEELLTSQHKSLPPRGGESE